MATVQVQTPKKKAVKGKVAHIKISPGEKGSVVVRHREHPQMQRQPGGMMRPMGGPEKMQAFSSPDEAQGHVNDLMGQLSPVPDGSSGDMY